LWARNRSTIPHFERSTSSISKPRDEEHCAGLPLHYLFGAILVTEEEVGPGT
jgi:hypothetical protein